MLKTFCSIQVNVLLEYIDPVTLSISIDILEVFDNSFKMPA